MMKFNRLLITSVISGTILSGCGTTSTVNQDTIVQEKEEVEVKQTASEPTSPFDELESPYKEIAIHFSEWQPPTEGLLTREEAPEEYKGWTESIKIYENGYIWDDKSKMFVGRIHRDGKAPEPTEQQKTGFFITTMNETHMDLSMLGGSTSGTDYLPYLNEQFKEMMDSSTTQEMKDVSSKLYSYVDGKSQLTEEEFNIIMEEVKLIHQALEVSRL